MVGGGGGDRLGEAVGLGVGELLFPAGCSFPGIQPSGRARFLVYPSRVRLSRNRGWTLWLVNIPSRASG